MAYTRSLLSPLFLLLLLVLGACESAPLSKYSTNRPILFPGQTERPIEYPKASEDLVKVPCRLIECYVPDGKGGCMLDKDCELGVRSGDTLRVEADLGATY